VNSARYIEAKRLLAFLGWARPAPPEFVPGDSLLREFVGGSVLEDYTPGVKVTPKKA
jgi:uridine kinase